ncbi:MAG: 23S rRNA (uracil(1939)-C(5))-methyltransferase RlmD [Edaphobacter sp.]
MKLQIEKAVYGGAGLAHQTEGADAGKAVFVPFTLPGEIVEARVLEQKNTFGEASLIQILSASKDRVQPDCAHFGQCGGCHYQHAAYPTQLDMKSAILQETLERGGLTVLPAITTHSGEPWAYRNRTRFRISELNETIQFGYNRRGSNDFLLIHECPISAPLLVRAAQSLLRLAEADPAVARCLRSATEVEFFTTGDETKLQMTLFVSKQQSGFSKLCEQLQQLVPELTGACASILVTKTPQKAKKLQPLASWGAGGLTYTTYGEKYWVSRGGFFQVNRFLIDKFVQLVTEGRHGSLAWDLYAGVGLFSRALARAFQQVVAVEAAADDLSNSFKGAGRRAVPATTVDFLRNAVVQRARPDLIVMDPPRAGVGAEVCSLLARVAAPEIVYVSCDPVTLARDLRSLTQSSYKIEELHLVDMFPQTFHLETIVVLRR